MPAPTPMTGEDLLHAPLPNKRTELVKGVLVVREPAGGRHGRITAEVARIYRRDGTEETITDARELEGEDVVPGFSCRLASVL